MNKFDIDFPCDLKLWLMYFSTIIIPFMQYYFFAKKAECHSNKKKHCVWVQRAHLYLHLICIISNKY